jgi:hypothetical protein
MWMPPSGHGHHIPPGQPAPPAGYLLLAGMLLSLVLAAVTAGQNQWLSLLFGTTFAICFVGLIIKLPELLGDTVKGREVVEPEGSVTEETDSNGNRVYLYRDGTRIVRNRRGEIVSFDCADFSD